MRIPTTVFAAMLALVSSSLGRDLKFKELADVYLSNGKVRVIRQMGRWVVRLLLRSGLIRSIFALEFS